MAEIARILPVGLVHGRRHQGDRGEHPKAGQRHVNRCFFTMVAVDEQHRPKPVPTLRPFSPEDKRRLQAAELRESMRREMEQLFSEV